MSKREKFLIVAMVIILAVASRLVKHPFNFTPIVAMALFAGAYLNKKWGILLPLVAMLISDYIIGFYDWRLMASVYVSIALAFVIGRYLINHKKWYNVIFSSIGASLIFFIISNLAAWAFFDWYPHTLNGLVSCFTMAIPFFRNTLAGDLLYTVALFGIYELVLVVLDKKVINAEEI